MGVRPDHRGVVIAAVHYDYPYRLKLTHPEMAELRLERKGRTILFDPVSQPTADDIVVLTGPNPTRLTGTLAAIRAGVKPTIVAPEPLFDWLGTMGAVNGGGPGRMIDDVKIDALNYPALASARPLGHFLQASLHAARPRATLRRFAQQVRLPACDPQVVELSFPDGTRLVHLDLSLNGATDEPWVTRAASRFGNANWTLVGASYGESAAVATWLPRFGVNRVLVVELTNGERRELGLPTELVTPLRDRLVTAGIEAHVFATQASYRFE